jgi:hypothetical protein
MKYLLIRHTVADSIADTIQQWFNAGGGVQFYDFTYDVFLNVSKQSVTVSSSSSLFIDRQPWSSSQTTPSPNPL